MKVSKRKKLCRILTSFIVLLIFGTVVSYAQTTVYESQSDNIRVIKVSDTEYRVEPYDINSNIAAKLPALYGTLAENQQIQKVVFAEGVQIIDQMAFKNCQNLSSITWPSTLKTIGDDAFNSCRNLQIVDLSQTSLVSVGHRAFYNCSSLSTVKLPSTLTYIYERAFYQTAITEITIPGKVMLIEGEAFAECPFLTKVTFADDESLGDNDVMLIKTKAFDNSKAITDVYVNRHIPIQSQNEAFEDDLTTAHGQVNVVLATLHFPIDLIDTYVNQKHYLDYATASDAKLYHEWLVEHYKQAGQATNGWFEFVNNGPLEENEDPLPDGKFLKTYSFYANYRNFAYEENGTQQTIQLTTAFLVPEGVRAYIVNSITQDGNFFKLGLKRLFVIPPCTGVILYGETNSHNEANQPTLAMSAVGYNGQPLRRDLWSNVAENMHNYLLPTVIDLNLDQVDKVHVKPYEIENGEVAWRNFAMGRINYTDHAAKDVNNSEYVAFFRLKESDIDKGKAYLRLKATEYTDPAGSEVIVPMDPNYNKEYKSNAQNDTDWDDTLSAKYWNNAIWTNKEDWSVRPSDFNGGLPLQSNFGEPFFDDSDGVETLVIPIKRMDDNCFTIQGVRIDKPSAPGVYIRNGKKFVVK